MFLLAGAGDVPIVVGLLLDRQCLGLRSRQEVGHLQVCPFLDGLLLRLWFGLGHCRRAHNMRHTARGPVTGYDCGYEGLDCPTKLPIVCRLALESGLVVAPWLWPPFYQAQTKLYLLVSSKPTTQYIFKNKFFHSILVKFLEKSEFHRKTHGKMN